MKPTHAADGACVGDPCCDRVDLSAVVALLMWGAPAGYELWAVLGSAPAALIAFWFWRHEFKRAWIEDPELLPDGVVLLDDDWQSGLLRLALVILIGIGIALFRLVTNGMADSL